MDVWDRYDEMTEQEFYEEILKTDFEHRMKWQPWGRFQIPFSIKPKDYAELIEKIEKLICEWTWEMIHMCTDEEMCQDLADFHNGITGYERNKEYERQRQK